jgi:hypothetical protein
MAQPTAANAHPTAGGATEAGKRPGRALVGYPYFNLSDSLQVARKIHEEAGGACTADQLAHYLNYKSTSSGTFQTRISAAKQFGLIRTEGVGSIGVTDRAMQILSPVMPEDAVNAKADAFLAVDLFAKIYEKYRGTTIPPKVGVKNLLLTTFGILPDRADPAVRVLFESADQAGFFPSGDQSRLIRPAAKPSAARTATEDARPRETTPPRGTGGGGDGPTGVHPAIVGLLRELPAPGSHWPKKSKDRFIKAFLASLDFVYPDDDEESIAPTSVEDLL